MLEDNAVTYASKSLVWPVEGSVGIRIMSEHGSSTLQYNPLRPRKSQAFGIQTSSYVSSNQCSQRIKIRFPLRVSKTPAHFSPQHGYPNIYSFINIRRSKTLLRPHNGSRGKSPGSPGGGTALQPGQCMWGLWWAKWHWGRFLHSDFFSFPYQYHSAGAPYSYITRRLISFFTRAYHLS